MWKTIWKVSIIVAAALPAMAKVADGSGNQPTIVRVPDPAVVVAQAPRPIDSTAILRKLAPVEYLPEHSGANRSIDLDIRFRLNSAKLSRAASRQLDELAAAIKAPRLRGARFRIAGHTDASGGAAHNKALSAKRAAAVKSFLVKRHGIPPARMETVGWGEERLKNPISPDAAENRRVEVSVLPARSEINRGQGKKRIEW